MQHALGAVCAALLPAASPPAVTSPAPRSPHQPPSAASVQCASQAAGPNADGLVPFYLSSNGTCELCVALRSLLWEPEAGRQPFLCPTVVLLCSCPPPAPLQLRPSFRPGLRPGQRLQRRRQLRGEAWLPLLPSDAAWQAASHGTAGSAGPRRRSCCSHAGMFHRTLPQACDPIYTRQIEGKCVPVRSLQEQALSYREKVALNPLA